MSTVEDMVLDWLALRQILADPSYRRDVCFICEAAPIQVRMPGAPVGVCRACDAESKRESAR